jgi:hypothetical protein
MRTVPVLPALPVRALSIRQPYAELILRGLKTVEYRSRPTRVVGERFWIYAAGKKWPPAGPAGPGRSAGAAAWSCDLAAADGPRGLPPWLAELASALRLFPHELPTGVIVGSAVIERVTAGDPSNNGGRPIYHWHLAGVERAERPRKPTGHPQPVWFKPF